jgi:hypothetical protein
MTTTEDVELKPCEWEISDEERKSHHWDFD